jgi:hypothetical protein
MQYVTDNDLTRVQQARLPNFRVVQALEFSVNMDASHAIVSNIHSPFTHKSLTYSQHIRALIQAVVYFPKVFAIKPVIKNVDLNIYSCKVNHT